MVHGFSKHFGNAARGVGREVRREFCSRAAAKLSERRASLPTPRYLTFPNASELVLVHGGGVGGSVLEAQVAAVAHGGVAETVLELVGHAPQG